VVEVPQPAEAAQPQPVPWPRPWWSGRASPRVPPPPGRRPGPRWEPRASTPPTQPRRPPPPSAATAAPPSSPGTAPAEHRPVTAAEAAPAARATPTEGVDDEQHEHDRQTAGELVPVKFSRLTRRGVLLGLSLTQLITLAIGGATLIGAFYAGGGMLLAYTAPIWVLAAALTWIPIAGRPIVEWLPIACWWLWRTTGGQLLYRRRIVVPRPVGTLALPGDMARLREYTDPDTGAGMIHDPHAATLTVVCEVTHPAFVLLDPGEQERRVTSWGRVLATVCRSGRIATLQVLERTLPDSGTGLAEWWATHGTPDGHGRRHLRRTDRPRRTRRRTPRHHALAVAGHEDQRPADQNRRRRDTRCRRRAAARDEHPRRRAPLRRPVTSGWLTPGQIAVMLRSAYDPAIAATLERHGRLGQSLATAGPVAVTETWGGCAPTPLTTRCSGSASGRGRWCIRGSCRRCCCPPASSGRSR
jgi:hypothetical protein